MLFDGTFTLKLGGYHSESRFLARLTRNMFQKESRPISNEEFIGIKRFEIVIFIYKNYIYIVLSRFTFGYFRLCIF